MCIQGSGLVECAASGDGSDNSDSEGSSDSSVDLHGGDRSVGGPSTSDRTTTDVATSVRRIASLPSNAICDAHSLEIFSSLVDPQQCAPAVRRTSILESYQAPLGGQSACRQAQHP